MSLQLAFWIAYLVALVLSFVLNPTPFRAWAGGSLIFFLLIGILGVAVFGKPIHG